MAPTMAAWPDSTDPRPVLGKRYSEPLAGMIVSVVLSWLSNSIISMFFYQRVNAVDCWRQLPFVQWIVLAIYVDSFLFVFATAIIQFGFNVDFSHAVCETAILVCLICYVTTKLIYLFLVEKAYIIRSKGKKTRLRSKLYIFNAFGMLGVYNIIVVLNFVFRIAKIDDDGKCIIGMEKVAMIPLIGFDLLINIYLTVLFLIPLTGLYNFRRKLPRALPNHRLKMIAKRTFVGCVCTLTSSVVNLTVLMLLEGEPGWVCLMCCNSDILFSAVVVHWITFRDSTSMTSRDGYGCTQAQSNTESHSMPEDADTVALSSRRKASYLPLGATGLEHGRDDAPPSRGSQFSKTPYLERKKSVSTELDDMYLEQDSVADVAEPSPCSTSTFGSTKGDERGITRGRSPDKTIRPVSPVYAPTGKSRQPSHNCQKPHSASEVRVDVDYGASLEETPDRDASSLGNSVTIDAQNGHHKRSRASVLRRGSDL